MLPKTLLFCKVQFLSEIYFFTIFKFKSVIEIWVSYMKITELLTKNIIILISKKTGLQL
jgi:hypothetical protein